MTTSDSFTVFTDGGARGNPGPAASAFIVLNQSGKELFKSGQYLGVSTNNVAEYNGVLQALQWIKSLSLGFRPTEINFLIDSQLVVNQLKGKYKIKDSRLRSLILEIHSLEVETGVKALYELIPREKNQEADLLVNKILDQQLLS